MNSADTESLSCSTLMQGNTMHTVRGLWTAKGPGIFYKSGGIITSCHSSMVTYLKVSMFVCVWSMDTHHMRVSVDDVCLCVTPNDCRNWWDGNKPDAHLFVSPLLRAVLVFHLHFYFLIKKLSSFLLNSIIFLRFLSCILCIDLILQELLLISVEFVFMLD